MPQKMIPPLPAKLGESEDDRFERLAMAILTVLKSEITLAVQVLPKLEAKKQEIDAKFADVRRETAKRNAKAKRFSRS